MTAAQDKAKEALSGLKSKIGDEHEARVSVVGADNVDARLDNRVGADRPPLESFPAKPQQIDGPDVQHQVEHTRRTLDAAKAGGSVERKGMFSPGPHGLSDEDERKGTDRAEESGGKAADDGEKGAPAQDVPPSRAQVGGTGSKAADSK